MKQLVSRAAKMDSDCDPLTSAVGGDKTTEAVGDDENGERGNWGGRFDFVFSLVGSVQSLPQQHSMTSLAFLFLNDVVLSVIVYYTMSNTPGTSPACCQDIDATVVLNSGYRAQF